MEKGKKLIPSSSPGSSACLLVNARGGLIMGFSIKTTTVSWFFVADGLMLQLLPWLSVS
jgi:hypothetical protein